MKYNPKLPLETAILLLIALVVLFVINSKAIFDLTHGQTVEGLIKSLGL